MFAGSSTGVHFISQAEQQLQMLRIHSDTFPSSVYSLYLHNLWSVPSQDSDSQIIAAITGQIPLDAIDILEKTIDRWTPLYPIVHKQSTIEAFQKLYDDPEHGDLSILYQVLGLLALGTLGHAGSCDQTHRHFLCVSDKYYTIFTYNYLLGTLLLLIWEEWPLEWLKILVFIVTHNASNLTRWRLSCGGVYGGASTLLTLRFSSAYHGMPRLIRDQDVDTDLPSRVDHDQVSRNSVAFPLPGERSQVDSALCMFKLAVIVGEALEKLYTTTRRRGGVAKITQLQAELTMWERMLPIDKAADADDEGVEPPAVSIDAFEVAFLRAAFCNATVHVHRPALAFTTADPQFTISLMACGRASAELIRLSSSLLGDLTFDTTHRKLDAMIIAHLHPNGRHMLWQAGLTILFARWKGQPITTDEGDEDLVRTCAETLRQFREENAKGYINQCAEVLDMLRVKTFSSKETQPPGMDQLQWNVWDWPMASALELANTLDAMPLDLQFGPGLDL
ncbi:hypothetical protein CkaCkLH20_07984 [Colletotrichum karsti]|uniref:Uncharacterized protein n=1 Tax=Colletotrichum karsti TaxID=1095194 RepID=A0A9P6I3R4_9PEZI|nr:uncharacterized protein CkaCkLH20_07984 [Colletotrichum karsti]KAF9874421.1 hypothetical protein CkaCkLH20_07984 [Colletotrichum karsti]